VVHTTLKLDTHPNTVTASEIDTIQL